MFYSSKFECIYCGYISRGSKRNQCKKCNKCKWQKQVDTFIELDEDLAFLAGLIISDGHVMKLENSIEFCGNDINLVNICFDLFEKIFDEHISTLYYAPPLSFEEKEARVKSVSSAAW